MKNIFVVLGLTSVLLTGCNGGSGDHDVQKVVDQVSKQPVPTELKNWGNAHNSANQPDSIDVGKLSHTVALKLFHQ